MKRLMLLLTLALSIGVTASLAAQEITGTVHDSDGNPIQGIAVLFLDARDGLLLATTTTTVSGEYASGTIPTGNYRVRFLDEYGAGAPGFFVPEFAGADGSDVFCSASVVSVLPGATATVDESMTYQGPTKVVTHSGSIVGQVTAAESGVPLPGIQVAVVDAANAWPVVSTKTQSDAEPGVYDAVISQSPTPLVRIRFADPARSYFPEFFGAGGADDFCAGTSLGYEPDVKGVSVAMSLIPPGQVVDTLRDAIDNLDLPTSVSNMLDQPLTQTVALLTDSNANNDDAVCRQLESFISRVEIQQANGQLTAEDAASLIQSAELSQSGLGCL